MTPITPLPPVAFKDPQRTPIHNADLVDDYGWLREKGAPRVTEYLEAENAYTAAMMADTEALQKKLYDEILSHIKEDDVSVPYRDGAWEYISRTEKGKQYPRFCRRPVGIGGETSEADEVTILDVNELAEGQPFMSIGGLALSPDGNLLAYSTDNTGFRQYTLAVKDLRTNKVLADRAERVGSIVWAADSRTIFYSTEDEQTKRQDRVFRHVLEQPQSQDVEVFHEPDERFNVGLGRTRDRKYIMLGAGSHTTSETWFLKTDTPDGDFNLIAPRVDDEEYDVDHRDGFFYIRTNLNAERFKLVRTPVEHTDREHWQEVIAEKSDAPLEDVDLYARFLVTQYSERGLPVLRIHHFDASNALKPETDDIRFPDPAYTAYGEVNRDFNATTYRYSYQSLVRPASVYSYDITTKESTLLKQNEVPGGFDASKYESRRLWFKAADGTEVPVSLVFRTDKFTHGKSPLYVYGYGSYGYPLPLGFSASRLALLDRGVVVVYAHIRGGGELGDPWHDAGKMMQKRNTFTDFIEATEFLVREGYGDPARVAIEGGSAGGLLMGAVTNLRPDLFRVVLSHVPFVDVMNTMLDATLPLTVAEYEEWGNPNEPEAFAYMRSYSPYDNLDALSGKKLPAILVKTSLNDSQVMYWEPAKYVAKLRTLKTDAAPLLLHINMDAGHGGASGRYDYLKEIAFDDAFLLKELGVE
ncbi:S9 family peptidase [Granulicella cerasi]|uniref:S9 family peptidase n=1 Tax=Granulicella cerasi TaxID=741063 RepID=A0ABW1Z3W3_9BACT|nr:S9 family peptidase [Granulicella cerasi]